MKKLKIKRRLWLFRLFGETTGPLFFGKILTDGMVLSKTWMSYRSDKDLLPAKIWGDDIYHGKYSWSTPNEPSSLFRHEFGHVIDIYQMSRWKFSINYLSEIFKKHDDRFLEKSADDWSVQLLGLTPKQYKELLK
jgi:hypothetical protein